jgi:hypothetical protein
MKIKRLMKKKRLSVKDSKNKNHCLRYNTARTSSKERSQILGKKLMGLYKTPVNAQVSVANFSNVSTSNKFDKTQYIQNPK